jgi:uncharacterized protein YecE (DUF72 family)
MESVCGTGDDYPPLSTLEATVRVSYLRRHGHAWRRQRRLQSEQEHAVKVSPAPPPAAKSVTTKFYIWRSGWFYWLWRGDFYPEDLPTNEWFAHHASRSKTVEINASCYSWPTEATVKTWVKQTGRKKFIYTVKVCELITHVKRFACSGLKLPDQLVKTADDIYIRFHGIKQWYRHDYSKDELRA